MEKYLSGANLHHSTFEKSSTQRNLRELIFENLITYFRYADPKMPPRHLYELVMEEIEPPLLESVMKYVDNNQCRAAEVLGISRAHLRKKLAQYGFLKKS